MFTHSSDRYTKALDQQPTQQQIDVLKQNRSLALTRTGQYDAALADTGFPNFGDSPAVKSLYRAAEALYHLERFEVCCQVLGQLLTQRPKNPEATTFLARAKKRLAERDLGIIDLSSLQIQATMLSPPRIDHATYLGPIEIRESSTHGRGVFVTKAVKAGDLLLCKKAFSYAYMSDEPESGTAQLTLMTNIETGRSHFGAEADLLQMTVQKLMKCPSLAPSFTSLHHGSFVPLNECEVDGKPIVDT